MASIAACSALVERSSVIAPPRNSLPPKAQAQALKFTTTHHRTLSYSTPVKMPLAVSEMASFSSNSAPPKRTAPIVVIDNYDSFTYNLCQVGFFFSLSFYFCYVYYFWQCWVLQNKCRFSPLCCFVLLQYMGELGYEFEVYRNDELTIDELKAYVVFPFVNYHFLSHQLEFPPLNVLNYSIYWGKTVEVQFVVFSSVCIVLLLAIANSFYLL